MYMEELYSVYKHTLPKEFSKKDNDMVYIGITCQYPERRWMSGNGYIRSRYFYHAIQKYGWDSFSHDVLFTGLLKEEAELKEKELIVFYKSNDRNFGYNIQSGGTNGYSYDLETRKIMSKKRKDFLSDKANHSLYGKHQSEETKQKISETQKRRYKENENSKIALIGRTLSEDTKSKISIAAKERLSISENNPFYGKHHTKETKLLLSQKAKERFKDPTKNPNYGNRRKVRCIETGEIFDSAQDICKKYGIKINTIYAACRRGSLCKNMHFEYVKE